MPGSSQELLECFDDQGNVIEPQIRSIVHTEPLQHWHGVANIWIFDKQGKLLCSQRSSSCRDNPGKWQTYFGGHVKAGHTFEQTALLELQEEIGIDTSADRLQLVLKSPYQPAMHLFAGYILVLNEGERQFSFVDGEVADIRWLGLSEYRKEQSENPELWCNNISAEMETKIKEILQKNN